MELNRRDALEALVAVGILGAGAVVASDRTVEIRDNQTDVELTENEIATLKTVGEVVIPSKVDVTTDFIRTYVRPLTDDRKRSISKTIRQLNDHTATRHGTEFHAISSEEKCEAVLRSMGVSSSHSNPDGNLSNRVRYHLVNSLLFAVFTSPRGSELFGITNPVGYPGGYESLMRFPHNGEPNDG